MKTIKIKMFLKALLLISFMFNFNGNVNMIMAQTGTNNNTENNENEQSRVKYKVRKKLFKYNNVLSIYPFQAINNYMTLGYEFKTGEKTAFKTIAGFAQKEGDFYSSFNQNDATMTKYSAFKIEMQFKYFINKKGTVFNGVYFSPFVAYKACNFEYDINESILDPVNGYYYYQYSHKKDKASAFHVGFLLGYHQRVGENFTLDVFAGEGLMSSSGNYKTGSRIFDTYTNAIRIKLGVCAGFGL